MSKVNVDDVLESIESWTVLDLNKLVKGIEDKFGVSAAAMAPVAVAGGAVAQGEAWSQYNFGSEERLRLRVGMGQWRTLRGDKQSSSMLNVSVGYAFGSLLR